MSNSFRVRILYTTESGRRTLLPSPQIQTRKGPSGVVALLFLGSTAAQMSTLGRCCGVTEQTKLRPGQLSMIVSDHLRYVVSRCSGFCLTNYFVFIWMFPSLDNFSPLQFWGEKKSGLRHKLFSCSHQALRASASEGGLMLLIAEMPTRGYIMPGSCQDAQLSEEYRCSPAISREKTVVGRNWLWVGRQCLSNWDNHQVINHRGLMQSPFSLALS